MWDFLNGWAGQLVGAAGIVLALAGIFGLGFRIGVRERDKRADDKATDLETLVAAARREIEGWRERALVWEGRYKELAGTPLDRSAQHKLDDVRAVVLDGKSLWFRPVTARIAPKQISDGGKPIITVGNLKGGVGKTTLATHLAYMFAEKRRVLFIDLDFQGTGSSLLLRAAGVADQGLRSRADLLIKNFSDYTTLRALPISLGAYSEKLSVISSHYSLADAEEALMLKWLIGDEPDDIRFNLSKALQSPAFQFDLAVIDAPPRLTTALAQALAASTHVLIPTQLERKSTEAALYFASMTRQFAERAINPSLQVLGVVPNMIANQNGPEGREVGEISYLNGELDKVLPGSGHVWDSTSIYDRVAFARSNLAFAGSDSGAREAAYVIGQLASRIARRVGFEG